MKALLLLTAAAIGGALLAPAAIRAQSAEAVAGPTFTRDVAPIFYSSCTSCHRPGEIAPMSLLTYKDARPFARAIAAQVSRGVMPPWHADPAHGEFLNDRRLTPQQKDTILKWVANGAPEGAAADLPAQPNYPDGWQIGQPDAVFSLPEAYPVAASGTIDYKYFEVPTNFTEDKWIQAFQVRPGTPAVVHHVIVYARTPKRAQPVSAPSGGQTAAPAPQRRQGPFSFAPNMEEPEAVKTAAARQEGGNDRPVPEGGLGAFVGGFAPGQGVRVFQPGTAMKLPAGATLVFQMHYTAKGMATTDRSKIGFVFANEAPKQEAITAALVNANFTLPAGSPDTLVEAQMTLNTDLTMWSLMPHTHVRGRRWQVEVTYPDGRTETVLGVPNYDFNWQTDYVFKQPLKLPKGTVLRTSAWYDNSAANKSNPNAAVDVHWGEQTWEEMQFTAFTFTLDQQPRQATGQN
jgi:hypothetical protein